MGQSYRKSLSAGPFRFNLSGAGIGVSVGSPDFASEQVRGAITCRYRRAVSPTGLSSHRICALITEIGGEKVILETPFLGAIRTSELRPATGTLKPESGSGRTRSSVRRLLVNLSKRPVIPS
ncbi:DUF4236 domain-containing protein [Paraburkholderia sp. IW21]